MIKTVIPGGPQTITSIALVSLFRNEWVVLVYGRIAIRPYEIVSRQL